MQRLEHLLAQLLPHFAAMDPPEAECEGLPRVAAFLFSVLRYATRMTAYSEISDRPLAHARSHYLAAACLARLLAIGEGQACLSDLGAASVPWLGSATAHWTEAR